MMFRPRLTSGVTHLGHAKLPHATSLAIVKRRETVHILLAEDNEVNQLVASELLARVGYACEIVDNGQAAVDATSSGRFDLILMDCQMPALDGFEATRAIRQREANNPGSRKVIIVALTANAIKGDRERCLAAGMDGYLSKPLDPFKLVDTLDAMLAVAGQSNGVAADTSPAIDLPTLRSRCMDDPEMVTKMLELFERRAAATLVDLMCASEAGDLAAVTRSAHMLSGTASNLSATRLAELAEALELASQTTAAEELKAAVAELADETARCLRSIPEVQREVTGS